MPDIRIIQLNPAPEGLWRFYALSSDVDGEAVVYLSRILSVALVQDMDHLGGVIGQRVVPITTAALTDPGELHDCLSLQQSWQHVEVARVLGLPEASELAEKMLRRIFSRALAGHDVNPGLRSSGPDMWALDAGSCSHECPRCSVERSRGEKGQ
jgi:hypothetical protein